MAERPSARRQLVWTVRDPEPRFPVRLRCDCHTTTWNGTPLPPWQQVRASDPDGLYRWHNGDKTRTWPMLAGNHGPLINVDRLSRIRVAYRRRSRRG